MSPGYQVSSVLFLHLFWKRIFVNKYKDENCLVAKCGIWTVNLIFELNKLIDWLNCSQWQRGVFAVIGRGNDS